MNINIIAIGKITKNAPEGQIIADYIKRLNGWKIAITEFAAIAGSTNNKEQIIAKESELLLGKAINLGANKMIALDRQGHQLDSPAIAGFFNNCLADNYRDIAIFIGGSDGLSAELKQQCDVIWSFGKITMPHILARIVLVEQLYRAYTINNNHPYHK